MLVYRSASVYRLNHLGGGEYTQQLMANRDGIAERHPFQKCRVFRLLPEGLTTYL